MKKVLAKIKAFFENLMFGHSSRTLEAGIVRKCGVDVVDGLMAQYEKTFFAALEGNAARNALGEFEQGGVRVSLFSDIDDVQEARTESREIISILEANLHLVASGIKFELESDGVVPGKKSEFVNNVFVSQGGFANNKTLGRVELSNKGAKSTIFHGYGKNKLIATHAIKSVIENGDIISTELNYKGKGKDRYIIAAKGLINQVESYLAVVVEGYPLNGGHKQFYLHEVLTKETAPHIMTVTQENADTVSGTVPTISIPQNDEKSTPDAKKLLENRVSGDDLLNAQDLIADVQELGGQVDEYGYITLYHRTSADKAAAIRSTGEMVAKENGLFFSTKQEGQNVGYGDTVVTFSIPAEKLLLDDVFDEEAHLRFPLKKPGRVSVKEYLASEDTGDTGLHSDPEDDIDNRTFSYNELVAKGDLQGVVIGKARQVPLKANGGIDDDAIVKDVKSKCQTITTKGGTTYFVSVPDIGRNVEIANRGVTHGFMKPNDQKNGVPTPHALINARVSLDLPQILENSIEVNRSQRGTNIDVPYTHVMMGTVALEDAQGKLEYYAVRSMILERKNQNPILVEANVLGKLHAANAQKISTPTVRGAQNGVALADGDAYTYSIADFLQDVKGVFDDTFSLDVYNRLGVQRKASEFSQYLLHSDPEDDVKSDREILAGALMSVAQNEIERNALKVYQGYAKKLDEMNARLREVNAEIRTMMFQKGARDEAYTKKLEDLKAG